MAKTGHGFTSTALNDDINAKFIIFFPVVLSSCPADEKSGGTQVKMVLTFRDGGQSLMKPWR